jgi:nucleoside-diphosphate-sugar epimerase
VEVLADIVGVEPDVVELPSSTVAALAASPTAFGHLFGTRHHGVVSIDKAHHLLGVSPTYDFRRGHEHTYEWFTAQGWASLDNNLRDPVWRSSWDFDYEARVAAQVRGAA